MPKEDPRTAAAQVIEGIVQDSVFSFNKIKGGIASLADLIQKFPEAITSEEDQKLQLAFTPILDLIEGYTDHLQKLKELAKSIQPFSELTPISLSWVRPKDIIGG